MRKLLVAFFVLFAWSAVAQPLVGPVPEPLSFAAATYTESTKPVVTPAQAGTIAYISDCLNGSQVAPGTGCLAYVNSSGVWVDLPTPPNSPITVGGQPLYVGSSTTNQGNGPKIQLATGAFTVGHALAFDASGNATDSGGAAQGGGTVSTGTGGLLATYATTGNVLTGLATVNNAVVSTDGSGNARVSTTLPSGLIIPTPSLKFASSTFGALPAVTGANAGQTQFVSDCQNGSEGAGAGTGCLAVVNGSGVWNRIPSPTNLQVTVGGQPIFLGGSTTNQGTGNKIQLSSGTAVNGHCVQYDASGNTVDSGAGCGGGGGGGTVAAGLINQLAYYTAAGTTLGGLTVTNNAVLVTSAGGVPSEATTLPSGLTIPSPTISNPTISGTASAAAVTLTGALTTAASVAGGANVSIPQGTAPTSPSNGNLWATTNGLFGRYNGVTFGPYIGTAQITATSPVTSGAGNIACPTCATTTNGGTITGVAPIAVSAAGAISLLQTKGVAFLQWDASTPVTNDTRDFIPSWQTWAAGAIQAVHFKTGGNSTPSFTITVQINGVNVTGCSALTVSSSSNTDATCTAANTFVSGQSVTLVVGGVTGSPFSAEVGITFTHTPT